MPKWQQQPSAKRIWYQTTGMHYALAALRNRSIIDPSVLWGITATSQARVFIPSRATAKTLVQAGHVGLYEFIA